MRAGWTASGACTSGSTAHQRGATRRASGGAATTSTTSATGWPVAGTVRQRRADHPPVHLLGTRESGASSPGSSWPRRRRENMSEISTGGAIHHESGRTAALGAADWLCLAAAPAFAIMALLTGVLGGGAPDMLCSAAQDASPLSGMVPMY